MITMMMIFQEYLCRMKTREKYVSPIAVLVLVIAESYILKQLPNSILAINHDYSIT